MKTRILFLTTLLAAMGTVSLFAQSGRDLIEDARIDMRAWRYSDAESTLALAVNSTQGELRYESMFLLAGLKSSVPDASRIYRRVISEAPDSDWAKQAQLELSKIQYALGNYEESLRLLEDSQACDISDEACLFQGLSAIMLERYRAARRPLGSIRKGRLSTWAYLSLAEVETGMDRLDQACTRYESLAGAMINPTALYRYAECLENRGDVEGAGKEYREIISNFRDTPEAVLAAEKLTRLPGREVPRAGATVPADTTTVEEEAQEVLTSGFTIQFGSFRDRGNAIKLSAKIKRVFPGARIDSELINYREYHRVRYGYFKTREEAQAKAEELSREMNEDFSIMTLP
jgi:tetratricopeptide (TPR) repeat protein